MSHNNSLRILCLWLPDWPVQHYLQKHPEYRKQAIAFSTKRGRAEEIVSCSPRAKQAGICSGMRTPDAEALAGANQLTVLHYRPQSDHRALEQLASECQRFSPFVALENAEEPSSLMLEVKGLSPLWAETQEQGELELLHAVDRWGSEKRLNVFGAIASTPGLAWAAAHFTEWLPGVDDESRIIPADSGSEIAQQLPVESLRIEEPTIETLHSLGIESIGQLLLLPKMSLRSRFGPELLRRLDQLLGDAPEPLSYYESDQPLVVQWPFETAVTNGGVLESVLGRLLERLTQILVQRQCGVLRVRIFYYLEASRHEPTTKRIELRLFRPTTCPKELAELAALQIAELHFSHAVKTIRVQIVETAPLEIRQRKLFDDESRQNTHELALLVNRLSSRIGSNRVLRIEKQSSHDPRRSFRYLPATEFEAKPYRLTAQQIEHLRRFPLALHGDQSQSIQVKTLSDNTPAAILRQGWQKVVHTWGPERVETGWWRGRGFRRDAYWIELTDGSRLWLNFDRRSRQWRLAGEFF
ncbi:MAG: DNA polymerase Y family protein [Pseudomonadota bacterium]